MRWKTLVFAAGVSLGLAACGGAADQPTVNDEPETQASDTPTTATTTTADPNALVVGEVRAVSSVSSVVGSGVVSFDAGPDAQTLRATLVGSVPVEDGAGEVRFCQFCVEEIRIAPGVEVPMDLFLERAATENDDLGLKIASEDATIKQYLAMEEVGGFNVIKIPQEVVSIEFDAIFDVPVASFSFQQSLTAGPEGCVLKLSAEGFTLEEGSAAVIST